MFQGISLNNSNSSLVDANWIYCETNSPTPSYFNGISGMSSDYCLTTITNNMISFDPNEYAIVRGISSSGRANLRVINNSVRIDGSEPISNYPYYESCLSSVFSGSSTGLAMLVNNVFVNNRSGGGFETYHLCIDYSSEFPIYSDNNILSANHDSPFDNTYVTQRRDSTSNSIHYFNTLDELRSIPNYSYDSLSIGDAPVFVGAHDLRINPAYPTPVEGRARPYPMVPHDFDSNTRNPDHPDIGCQEGNFRSGDCQRPSVRFTPLPSIQLNSPRLLPVTIRDNTGVSVGANAPRLYFKLIGDSLWTWRHADSIRSDSIYFFTIPGFGLNSCVQYYVAAQDTARNVMSYPFGARGVNPPGTIATNYPALYYVATPLTGVKTIAGSNPDFSTIQQAISAIQMLGVGLGGVTFRIRGGTYSDSTLVFTDQLDANHPAIFAVDSVRP